MFETSIQGPLTAAIDDGPLTSDLTGAPSGALQVTSEVAAEGLLVVCFPCDPIGGEIDFCDTGTFEDMSPPLAPSIDNSGLPPSVVPDDTITTNLTQLPVVSLTGTAGPDVLVGDKQVDVISGLGGDDVLRGRASGDVLYGGGGADSIMGNGGRDFIKGNGGDDVIRAGIGDDVVRGGGGADKINGGGGADRLIGGAGDDTIIGRTGDDTLKGGAGADVFQFRASDRNDTILDFEQGQDRIEILNGATSFAELSIQQDGADVLITFGSGQVSVISDDADLFDASDFIF